MSDLNDNQQTVLNIVRAQGRFGDPVAATVVRDEAKAHGISANGARSALDALEAHGLIVKCSPGNYLLADAA